MKFIAEFCQNHNGDTALLKEMVHSAAEAGADFGKIQTIFADDLTFRSRFENGEGAIKRPYLPEYERLKKLELSYEQQASFVEECRRYNLVPLTTCFTVGSMGNILEVGFRHIKVASYDCASLPLIRKLSGKFESLIISTGATRDEEIEATASVLNERKVPFSFLHCVTLYPTPLESLNLNRMKYLRSFTKEVGLSEHTHAGRNGIKASLVAIYLGADLIERHFRGLSSEMSKDGPVSIDAQQVRELVAFNKMSHGDQLVYLNEKIPGWEMMLGSERRELTEEELRNRDYYRGRFASHRYRKPLFNWEDDVPV